VKGLKAAAKLARKAAGKRASKAAAKGAGKAVARKAATKAGAKVAAKTGSKLIPGVGELVMVAEGAPVAWSETRRTAGRVREGLSEARGEWRQGRKRKAVGRAARTSVRAGVDVVVGTARTGVAALTAREVAEAALPARRNGKQKGSHDWDCLLACMIQLRTAYQYMHWNAKAYANHLLYERLYLTLDEDIDTLAELTVEQMGVINPTAPKAYNSPEAAEKGIIEQATKLAKAKGVSLAMENYLLNLIENRRRALYLLRQAE
jgi:DNA-binding ferritin-like protein